MLNGHDPIFGKNVLETLSEGMYDNPLFLFREYVQNAADAIDAAEKMVFWKKVLAKSLLRLIERSVLSVLKIMESV